MKRYGQDPRDEGRQLMFLAVVIAFLAAWVLVNDDSITIPQASELPLALSPNTQ